MNRSLQGRFTLLAATMVVLVVMVPLAGGIAARFVVLEAFEPESVRTFTTMGALVVGVLVAWLLVHSTARELQAAIDTAESALMRLGEGQFEIDLSGSQLVGTLADRIGSMREGLRRQARENDQTNAALARRVARLEAELGLGEEDSALPGDLRVGGRLWPVTVVRADPERVFVRGEGVHLPRGLPGVLRICAPGCAVFSADVYSGGPALDGTAMLRWSDPRRLVGCPAPVLGLLERRHDLRVPVEPTDLMIDVIVEGKSMPSTPVDISSGGIGAWLPIQPEQIVFWHGPVHVRLRVPGRTMPLQVPARVCSAHVAPGGLRIGFQFDTASATWAGAKPILADFVSERLAQVRAAGIEMLPGG